MDQNWNFGRKIGWAGLGQKSTDWARYQELKWAKLKSECARLGQIILAHAQV